MLTIRFFIAFKKKKRWHTDARTQIDTKCEVKEKLFCDDTNEHKKKIKSLQYIHRYMVTAFIFVFIKILRVYTKVWNQNKTG